MGLLQNIVYNIRNGKRTITEPIFMKGFIEDNENLKQLVHIKANMTESEKNKIDKEIRAIQYGLKGEKAVAFELKNSLLPSVVLHDIRLVDGEKVAQFDFIVICSTCILVLEVKYLSGDIQVNEHNEFSRVIKGTNGQFIRKEGMYSPIEQNERHIRLLTRFLKKNDMQVNVPIKSAIIMTNPKSVIKKKYASKEVREKLYKVDQVVNLLQKEVHSTSSKRLLETQMKDIATMLIENHEPLTVNYEKKYNSSSVEINNDRVVEEMKEEIADDSLAQKLKSFRMKESEKHQLKPYMVFTNNVMDELIATRPITKDELLKVRGFGAKKVELYGDGIISIIKNHN
ncbi:NERD domain-containing protein [Bacillus cereus group sp. BfR-BA-01363]|uniref:NERD domain-containing protein n=1 Tax=Bacillus cereus group sp. BfR-BA-01363 TaxID=3094882 RepID=UPI0029C24F12|nr:NERD domain-containing protein [Bacillus cereus group sp. BfR-BA-01363]MDX5853697.1 NERD domain-containing protein [Bacillus cereus group sp. BfR-BA-01363]